MTASLFKQQHHRHRHKKFHVRSEAKGLGYRRFLGMPSHGPKRAAKPDLATEEGESQNGSGIWIKAIVLLCVTAGI